MIRGVVFDLDHTLFDRYETLKIAFVGFYDHYRDRIPQELSYDEFVSRFIEIEKKNIHFGWKQLFKAMGEAGIITPFREDEYSEATEVIWHKCWTKAAVEFPFAKSVLCRLRDMGFKIGLVTNGPHETQTAKLDLLGLSDYFDEIVISGDVGVHKPNAEPFLVLSRKIGIPPEELLYVGDHPLNDVDGSRRAGYTPVWVRTIDAWLFDDIEKAPFEVKTVEELPSLLEKINN